MIGVYACEKLMQIAIGWYAACRHFCVLFSSYM